MRVCGKIILFSVFAVIVGTFIVRTREVRRIERTRGLDESLPGLANVIDEVRFEGIPFESAIETLSRKSGVLLRVDWRGLERGGLSRGERISLRLYDVALRTALARTLACAGAESVRLDSVREGDGLRIATADSIAMSTKVLRLYDVGDLQKKPLVEPVPVTGVIPAIPVTPDSLVQLIEETVAPESWYDNGGNVGEIRRLGDSLLVLQSAAKHELIRKLLVEYRAVQSARDRREPPERITALLNVDADADERAAKLDARLDDIVIENGTLAQAVGLLQDKTRANIVFFGRALEASRIDPDTRVTLHVQNSTLGTALDRVLLAFGKGAIAYGVHDGLIVIERGVGPRETFTRSYDVHDFVDRFLVPNEPRRRGDAFARFDRKALEHVKEVLTSDAPSLRRTHFSRQECIGMLVLAIEEVVDTDSWLDNGGSIGLMREWDGILIVKQLAQNHRKVEVVLRNLRKLREAVDRGDRASTRPFDLLEGS